MKMIKINQKLDFGINTRFYAFKEFIKLDVDEKFSSIRLCVHVDVVEGVTEKFDIEKWERFIKSDQKMVFEIFLL